MPCLWDGNGKIFTLQKKSIPSVGMELVIPCPQRRLQAWGCPMPRGMDSLPKRRRKLPAKPHTFPSHAGGPRLLSHM